MSGSLICFEKVWACRDVPLLRDSRDTLKVWDQVPEKVTLAHAFWLMIYQESWDLALARKSLKNIL